MPARTTPIYREALTISTKPAKTFSTMSFSRISRGKYLADMNKAGELGKFNATGECTWNRCLCKHPDA